MYYYCDVYYGNRCVKLDEPGLIVAYDGKCNASFEYNQDIYERIDDRQLKFNFFSRSL